MKKALVAIATALCAAALFAGGVAASGDGGTVVDSGFACAVFDGNGIPVHHDRLDSDRVRLQGRAAVPGNRRTCTPRDCL